MWNRQRSLDAIRFGYAQARTSPGQLRSRGDSSTDLPVLRFDEGRDPGQRDYGEHSVAVCLMRGDVQKPQEFRRSCLECASILMPPRPSRWLSSCAQNGHASSSTIASGAYVMTLNAVRRIHNVACPSCAARPVVQTFQGKAVIVLFCMECRHAWSIPIADLRELMHRSYWLPHGLLRWGS